MNTWQSNGLTRLPMRLWRRFQYWRAMRIYARVNARARRDVLALRKADRLMARNVKPPMPLFDRIDDEGGKR